MGKIADRKLVETCPCGQWMVLTPKQAERKRYCSKACHYKFHGRPSGMVYNIVSVNPTWIKPGTEPWNKGKTMPRELVLRQSEARKGNHYSSATEFKPGQTKGESNAKWSGDNVGYGAVHTWIYRTYGKAYRCDQCATNDSKKYHWHNTDLKYTRDISNWEQLCGSCHRKIHIQWKKEGLCQSVSV